MGAWIYQDARERRKHAAGDCPWSVGWIDPKGKRRCRKVGTRDDALREQGRLDKELREGSYEDASRVTWAEFRGEYEDRVLSLKRHSTRALCAESFNHFERIAKPKRMRAIDAKLIADFIARRSGDKSRKTKRCVSPATVNRDLRAIKAALNIAAEWGYMPTVPRIRMVKEPKHCTTYVPADHFAKLYDACDRMQRPELPHVAAADWWRALLVFGYMTGWRISEILALRWGDVDLDSGIAMTRAEDNKGGRDEFVALHPIVIEHLDKIRSFAAVVFPWLQNRRTLWACFDRLQQAAGVPHYGFHDLRRAFASMNADRMTGDALQALMRHKSYLTTQRYIATARQVNAAVGKLYVPDSLQKSATG